MTQDLHLLAAAYALDALTPDERRAFEAHYPDCESCSEDVTGFRATAEVLAEATATAPPSELRARVMAEIATTRQLPTVGSGRIVDLAARRQRLVRGVLVSAAAVVVAVALTVTLARDSGAGSIDDVVAASDAVTTVLAGDVGTITIVWSAERAEAAVVATTLPDPGPNRVYELWFLLDEGVARAGLFSPAQGTVASVLELDGRPAKGWGITIEPEGGSDQPTGEVLYAGTF